MRKIWGHLVDTIFYSYLALTTTLFSTGYGFYLLSNPFLIHTQSNYEFLNSLPGILGSFVLPLTFIITGILNLLAVMFQWKNRRFFLFLLLFLWSVMLVGFIFQQATGTTNAGWLMGIYVITNLIGVFVEEGKNARRK